MKTKITIKELQHDYRPDEKFLRYGGQALTGAELLAIILRTGNREQTSVDLAAHILKDKVSGRENILNILHLDFEKLVEMKGVGRVKALQIKAVGELSKRICMTRAEDVRDFRKPETVALYYMEELRHRRREMAVVLLLDSACQLLKEIFFSEGSVNSLLLNPREIFVEAFRNDALNIILLHNHPSGQAGPSKADIEGTKRIKNGCMLLGLNLIDHIIIGDNEYFSFKDKGLINE